MSENKKKRYPTDRLRLHAQLEKKEKDLLALTEEVDQLRRRAKQADRTAIYATAELYNVSPEKLEEIMKSMFGDKGEADAPEILVGDAASEYPMIPEEEEDSTDEKET